MLGLLLMITPEQMNRFQTLGMFHPMTCRVCRGDGECKQRDVGLEPSIDHHILIAEEVQGETWLRCDCCGEWQKIHHDMEEVISYTLFIIDQHAAGRAVEALIKEQTPPRIVE